MLRHPSHDPILRVAFNTLFCDCLPDIPVVSGEADKLVSDSDFRAFVAELRTVHEHMRRSWRCLLTRLSHEIRSIQERR